MVFDHDVKVMQVFHKRIKNCGQGPRARKSCVRTQNCAQLEEKEAGLLCYPIPCWARRPGWRGWAGEGAGGRGRGAQRGPGRASAFTPSASRLVAATLFLGLVADFSPSPCHSPFLSTSSPAGSTAARVCEVDGCRSETKLQRRPPGTLASSLSWFNHTLHHIRLNKERQEEKEEVEEALKDSLMRAIRHPPVTMNCLISTNLPAAVLTVGPPKTPASLSEEYVV
ncbi:uncharacterized protein LOC144368627 [Ictidomys tridecemlineatus]